MEFPDYCIVKTIGTPKKNVILLHGYTANKDSPSVKMHEKNLEKLKNIRLIRCDLYGHGERSEYEKDKLNIKAMTDELIDMASRIKKEYGNTEVDVVGISLGGTIGINAVLEKPEVFDNVIGLASPVSRRSSIDLLKSIITFSPIEQYMVLEHLNDYDDNRRIFPIELLEKKYKSKCPPKSVREKIYIYSNKYDKSSEDYKLFAKKLCYTDKEAKKHVKISDKGTDKIKTLNHIFIGAFDTDAKSLVKKVIEES